MQKSYKEDTVFQKMYLKNTFFSVSCKIVAIIVNKFSNIKYKRQKKYNFSCVNSIVLAVLTL